MLLRNGNRFLFSIKFGGSQIPKKNYFPKSEKPRDFAVAGGKNAEISAHNRKPWDQLVKVFVLVDVFCRILHSLWLFLEFVAFFPAVFRHLSHCIRVLCEQTVKIQNIFRRHGLRFARMAAASPAQPSTLFDYALAVLKTHACF
jgi:hypothetical protein